MTNEFRVRGIPPALTDHFWPLCEPFVKRSLEKSAGEFTALDIRHFCKDRITQLWVASEGERVVGVCVTEIVNYPSKRFCRIICLAGNKLPDWIEPLDIILYGWAKEQGCNGVIGLVRKGYSPALITRGYKPLPYTATFKRIEPD